MIDDLKKAIDRAPNCARDLGILAATAERWTFDPESWRSLPRLPASLGSFATGSRRCGWHRWSA
jgi:hypothetical protein